MSAVEPLRPRLAWLTAETRRVLREELGYSQADAIDLVLRREYLLLEALATLPRRLALELARLETRQAVQGATHAPE